MSIEQANPSAEREEKRFDLTQEEFDTIFVNNDIAKREEAMKKLGIEYDMGEIEVVIDGKELIQVSTVKNGFEAIRKE